MQFGLHTRSGCDAMTIGLKENHTLRTREIQKSPCADISAFTTVGLISKETTPNSTSCVDPSAIRIFPSNQPINLLIGSKYTLPAKETQLGNSESLLKGMSQLPTAVSI